MCNAAGVPFPEIMFFKDGGTPVVPDDNDRITQSGCGELTITRVEENDGGSYRCTARNAGNTEPLSSSSVDFDYCSKHCNRLMCIYEL